MRTFGLIAAAGVLALAVNAQAAVITGVTATASSYNTGGAGFPPIHTIDESGLDTVTGIHNTSPGTSWLTPALSDVSAEYIQWDLGDSYVLDSIHVWNANQNVVFSTKSVDIYLSGSAAPGDPEGAGAANWTKLTGATVTLPQADNTGGYTGFDLETALSTTLPTTAVRFVRFELNSSYASNGASYTGIAEIQFFEGAAVPEPASLAGGLLGLALIAARRRRTAG